MDKKNLWIFTFEFAGVVKVGGLGEVPANQAKWLSEKYNITVFIPSHGIVQDVSKQQRLNLKKMDIEYREKINVFTDNILKENEEVIINFYSGRLNGNNLIILSGGNEFSTNILDEHVVYSPGVIDGKFTLFSRGIGFYLNQLLGSDDNLKTLPNIIHCHDHHCVPAMIVAKQILTNKNEQSNISNLKNKKIIPPATVFTIHLLTWPRKSLEFLLTCGIHEESMPIRVSQNSVKMMTIKQLYSKAQDNKELDASLEKVGVLFADMVTSVSEHYLKEDIFSKLDGKLFDYKSDFTWNGCDWDYETNVTSVLNKYSANYPEIGSNFGNFNRKALRKVLLTDLIGNMPENEPVNDSSKIEEYINEKLNMSPYTKDNDGRYRGKVEAFKEDGPLIMMTGRLSNMKGIDVLLSAAENVIARIPTAKFLLFLIPSEFSIKDIGVYRDLAIKYPDNIRVIFGKVFSLFMATHLSADVYCAPSRWEPFGIIALEAMASRVPVVASRVGGLQESVIDLRTDNTKGTGLLVPKDDIKELGDQLINLSAIMMVDEINNGSKSNGDNGNNDSNTVSGSITDLIELINDQGLKKKVMENRNYGSTIRDNCYKRVEDVFRWKTTSQKLDRIYESLLK